MALHPRPALAFRQRRQEGSAAASGATAAWWWRPGHEWRDGGVVADNGARQGAAWTLGLPAPWIRQRRGAAGGVDLRCGPFGLRAALICRREEGSRTAQTAGRLLSSDDASSPATALLSLSVRRASIGSPKFLWTKIDVAVDFVAPTRPGRYVSYWRLASPSGQKFGQRVWVHIQVEDPSFVNDNNRNAAIC